MGSGPCAFCRTSPDALSAALRAPGPVGPDLALEIRGGTHGERAEIVEGLRQALYLPRRVTVTDDGVLATVRRFAPDEAIELLRYAETYCATYNLRKTTVRDE